jgi:hypothetical protein
MDTKTLYHYCPLATAIEHVLPQRQLLLNLVGKTNDPRENKSFVFAATGMNLPDVRTLHNLDSKISQAIRKDCKMLCLCADDGDYFGYEQSRMWAMYGDNHKGVCIGLDTAKFIDENKDKIRSDRFKKIDYVPLSLRRQMHHKKIDHDKIEELGIEKYIEDFRNENMDYLFFTKNAEWESEHEIRLIYISDRKDNDYCQIRKSVKAIYLGVDFNEYYLPSIQSLCKGIDIFRLEYGDVRLTDKLIR